MPGPRDQNLKDSAKTTNPVQGANPPGGQGGTQGDDLTQQRQGVLNKGDQNAIGAGSDSGLRFDDDEVGPVQTGQPNSRTKLGLDYAPYGGIYLRSDGETPANAWGEEVKDVKDGQVVLAQPSQRRR